MKKKVVIIGSAYPLRGGLAVYNERLAREYIRQGHDVRIFTFSLQYPQFIFPGKSQYSEGPPPDDLDIAVAINSVNPLNWIKVGNRIKKLKPDIVIIKFWIPFMAPCLGTIARRIRSNGKSKVISIIDNIIPHEKRIGDKAFARYFVKSVNGFITMSEIVLKQLQEFDTKKPKKYCPHPIYDNFGAPLDKDPAKRMLNLKSGINYILFFGFIRDYKGLDLILEAMADRKLQDLPVKLIVAGEFYTDAKPYHQIIRNLKLQDKVLLHTDFIPDNDVTKYFSASDLVVQPYKSATQSGITQIAYHFNKPMVTTNVGGLPEIVPDGKVGYVVEPTPEAIADAVYKFYSQNKEETFRKNVTLEKEKFSWKNIIKTIDNLIPG